MIRLLLFMCVSSFLCCNSMLDDDAQTTSPILDSQPHLGSPNAIVDIPTAPSMNDSNWIVVGCRKWYCVGNDLSSGHDEISLTIYTKRPVSMVHVFLDSSHVFSISYGTDSLKLSISLSNVAVGKHSIMLSSDSSHTAFWACDFIRTHPLYVVVSNDWEQPSHSKQSVVLQENLHANHPNMRMTHFVGPYLFTWPEYFTQACPTCVAYDSILLWIKKMENTYNDEIGLHIHPKCNFVEFAGLQCITSPGFRGWDDPTGQRIACFLYTQEQFSIMLKLADSLFVANGLSKPTSFRAGGWCSKSNVLMALAENGYLVDASACNIKFINTPEFREYLDYWSFVDDTTQPYYPNQTDIASSNPPHTGILEIPDNGILVDYITSDQMIEIFKKNLSDSTLDAPRQLSIGYHPINFNDYLFQRIDNALTEIDRHLYSSDAGPVVYATMSECVKVWKKPEEVSTGILNRYK